MSDFLTKLKIEKYATRYVEDCPANLKSSFKVANFTTHISKGPYDFMLYFVTDLKTMADKITQVDRQKSLAKTGYLYFAYPKLKNHLGLPGIHRDDIFPTLDIDDATGIFGDTQLKFSRMLALDDDWTLIGLKVFDDKPNGKVKSQRVADYEALIPKLQAALPKQNQSQFIDLTPGKKRDWARYVYGVVQASTQKQHLALMIDSLSAGYTTITAYQQSLRQQK